MFGMVFFALTQWGIIVIISKTTGAADIGHFSLAMAIINPVFAFFSLQLKAHYATQKTNHYAFASYFATRIITSSVALVLIGAITTFFDRNIFFLLLVLGLSLAKYADSLSDLLYATHQKEENLRTNATSMILRGALGLLAFSLTIYISGKIHLAVFSLAFSWWIVFSIHDRNSPQKYNIPTRPNFGKDSVGLIKETWPMAFAVFFSSLTLNLPRYFISSNLGPEQLGVFSAQAYLLTFFCMFSVAIAQSTSTALTRALNKKTKQFIIILAQNTGIIGGMCLLILCTSRFYGEELLALFYSKEFINSKLLYIIIISCFFWGTANILDYGVITLRHLKPRVFVQIITGISMTITWFLLFPGEGIYTAGYCLLIGGIVQTFFYSNIIFFHK